MAAREFPQPRRINVTTDWSTVDLRSNLPSAGTLRAFCLIKVILGLAFRDKAFASKWICDPRDIWDVAIPDRLKSVPIEWAKEWMNIPVLRRSVRDTTGSVYTSPTLASQYNQMANWNRRLGRSFGMKEPFVFSTTSHFWLYLPNEEMSLALEVNEVEVKGLTVTDSAAQPWQGLSVHIFVSRT